MQDAVVKVITALRNEAESGDIEATGRLAYWLGVMLPAFGFSEKDVMSLPLIPKLLASHASTYAHRAADAGDVRGIVTLIWLARNSETTLAELRAKVSQFNSPESTSFIADLIDNWGPDFYIVRKIFPEIKEEDVLTLKRTWLRKAARAGNLDSYGQLAATYLAPTNYCDLRFGRTKTEREFEQKQRCEVDFKSDGAGVQDDLRDGVRVGNVYALMMSGALFLDGNGVAQDFETGLDYLKRSARIGNPYAFALLTRLYFDGGKGLSKSAENAYLYANLMKTFQGGYITTAIDYAEQQRLNGLILNAQKMLSTLEASLPPDIVSEAQQITRTWKRGAPIPAMAESEASDSPRGTGFFIDDKGGMITAAHVVTSCKRVKLVDIGKIGEVLAKDKANDIALVRFEQTPSTYARIRAEAPKVGEPVFVYGFPLGGAIAANGSITAGVVSALTGLENDSNRVQVSAPVQQGNSGGPLFDNHGSVVGMVDSKLNVLRIGKITGDLPQNVNFAIKNSSLSSFLDVQNAKYSRPSLLSSFFAKDGEAVAEIGKAVTYKVACAGK